MIPNLQSRIANFAPITLWEMESVKLLDRVDTKFTFPATMLGDVLDRMTSNYRILEVKNHRGGHYQTLYFDTPELQLFAQHHSGMRKRYKIRYRHYVESDITFFEIKAKNNKDRTVKSRITCPAIPNQISGEAECLLQQATPLSPARLKPSLWVYFTRLTFVDKAGVERMTVDVDLSYRHNGHEVKASNLVVAEVKRPTRTSFSPFIQMMRERRLQAGSMSKYCFGVAQLYPAVKMNLFKEQLKRIKEIAA